VQEQDGIAFLRYKTVKGHRYYQLVRNYREDGVHRQEVLCHLGPHDSIDAAIAAERRRIAPRLEYYESLADLRRSYNEEDAAWWEERAAKTAERLDNLLECKEKYF
jgi:hypothetical protein